MIWNAQARSPRRPWAAAAARSAPRTRRHGFHVTTPRRPLPPMRLVVQRVERVPRSASTARSWARSGAGAVVWWASAPATTPRSSIAWPTSSPGSATSTDAAGRTNLTLADVDGGFLVVSQFTLYADLRRGRRPVHRAALPEVAEPLVDRFVERLRALGHRVADGPLRRRDGGRAGQRRAVHAGARLGAGPGPGAGDAAGVRPSGRSGGSASRP